MLKNLNYFSGDTKILLPDSSLKPIKDIVEGEEIFCHLNGSVKVTSINSGIFNKGICKVNISNNIPIIVNKNSNFLNLNKVNGSEISYNYMSDCKYLLSTFNDKNITSDLNANKARLLGLYAAEGSLNKTHGKYRNVVTFSFNLNELNSLVKLTKELLEKEFEGIKVCTSTQIKSNKCTVDAYLKNIQFFFLKYVGEYSFSKKLHQDLIFSNEEIKKQFILGWLEGDGHISKDSSRVTGTTVSFNLASQIRHMLYSIGIHNTIYEQLPSHSIINGRVIKGKYNCYRLRINSSNAISLIKDSNKLSLNKASEFKKMNKFINNYCKHKVLKITDIIYHDTMYGISTENESYITNWIVCKNE